MINLTFEQFQEVVNANWKNASEQGSFRDCSPEFVNNKHNPGRLYYVWQNLSGFGFVAYDTVEYTAPWWVDNGRGAKGEGSSYEKANLDEDKRYTGSFNA